jgi:3-deoxy-D-manno-octulosonate 8-phosphate phosphatase (KDO 8-P phosphatase)
MQRKISKQLKTRLSRVRLFLCDVDGVLTDGAVYMGSGTEVKRFYIPDGLGLRFLQRHGIRVGWVSNRASSATVQRAQDLKIDFLQQVEGGKVSAVESLLAQAQCRWEDTCYMGDDVVDLPVLARAGLGVAVSNAIAEVKETAHYVTRAAGGHGAVREVVDLILQAQGRWNKLVNHYRELV